MATQTKPKAKAAATAAGMTAGRLRAASVKTETALAPVVIYDSLGRVVPLAGVEAEPARLVIRLAAAVELS
jgi:hypothetical protein